MSDKGVNIFSKAIAGVDIFEAGTWNGDVYTTDDLDEMVESFGQAGVKVRLKLGHDEAQRWLGQKDGAPALGWVTRLWRYGKKLYADFAGVPDAVVNLITNQNYRNKSAEIYWNYKDPTGKVWNRVLRAVSLLGADMPAVSTLDDLHKALMTHNLSADACIGNTTGTMSWTCDSYGTTINDGTGTYRVYDLGGGPTMSEEVKKGYEERIAKLQEELSGERKRAEDAEARAVKAESELAEKDEQVAVKEFEAKLESLIRDGRVLPAEKEYLVSIFKALPNVSGEDSARKKMVGGLEKRPKVVQFEEHSTTAKETTDTVPIAIQVDRLAKEYADKERVDYSKGVMMVRKNHPDLWEAYNKDRR